MGVVCNHPICLHADVRGHLLFCQRVLHSGGHMANTSDSSSHCSAFRKSDGSTYGHPELQSKGTHIPSHILTVFPAYVSTNAPAHLPCWRPPSISHCQPDGHTHLSTIVQTFHLPNGRSIPPTVDQAFVGAFPPAVANTIIRAHRPTIRLVRRWWRCICTLPVTRLDSNNSPLH